jgi:hypothetical protein
MLFASSVTWSAKSGTRNLRMAFLFKELSGIELSHDQQIIVTNLAQISLSNRS